MKIATIILISILLLIILLAYLAYLKVFYTSSKQKAIGAHLYKDGKGGSDIKHLMDQLEKNPCEEVYITTKDGKRLAGRYFHITDGRPLHIQFHGYRGSSTRDFCGGNLLARSRGHNTLLVDQRAHSKSDGHTITLGIKERHDCLCWVDYAVERFGKNTPIILSGISMGAATVLMAGGYPLPDNVVGIIADSPYSSPAEIIKSECKAMGLPPKLVFPFIRLGGFLFGGFDICSGSVIDAVKACHKPVLIIHGEADTFVPCQMSHDIFNACAAQNKRIETFAEASHGYSYIVDAKRYEKIVDEFIESVI